jgi:hypothetical protein
MSNSQLVYVGLCRMGGAQRTHHSAYLHLTKPPRLLHDIQFNPVTMYRWVALRFTHPTESVHAL